MKILVTGAAGFIGHALVKTLSPFSSSIVGLDNLNDYYDVSLKRSRLNDLESIPNFHFETMDLCATDPINSLFEKHKFDIVVNLAAQAGVRYSIENPSVYMQSNVIGFFNILEACRTHNVQHLLYASSSSIYGLNTKVPFSTADAVDKPISLYAATKKANELMAHTYSHLYGLKTTGLRFFTVYGPWGRPDMAMFKFTKAILEGTPIDIYNHGDLSRDFTYIDDIVNSVAALINPDLTSIGNRQDDEKYSLYNIGNGAPVRLMDFVRAVEAATGKKAICNYLPMQPGDVQQTWADTSNLFGLTGYRPVVNVEEGVAKFVEWYRGYYSV